MRGQIANNNNGTQLVPVYFDYSSRDDIPNFLSDRQFYSLPSAIDQLISSLSGIHARRIGDMAEYRIEYTNELEKEVSQLKSAICRVEKEHGCSRTGLQLVR